MAAGCELHRQTLPASGTPPVDDQRAVRSTCRSGRAGVSCPDIVRTLGIPELMSDRAIKPRRHRLEVRVTPEQDALIRQAADLEDTTVTAFVLDTVTARAKGVVKQHNDLVLSNQAFDRFIAELDKPAQPVPELVDLFKNTPKLREA